MSKKGSLVIGSSADDFLFTGSRNHTIVWGRDGNDVIEDQKADGTIDLGRDYLWGNYGDDLLITHAGRDILGGGDDNDTLVVDKRLGDLANVRLRGGSGDNTAIIVTDDASLLDHDVLTKKEVIDVDGYQVKLHRVQHVDFMTAEEFAEFKADWHQPVDTLF